MAKLSPITPECNVENQHYFNRQAICSYKETFDLFTPKESILDIVNTRPEAGVDNTKKIISKDQKEQKALLLNEKSKFQNIITALRCAEYEKTLPYMNRGPWAHKKAYKYKPTGQKNRYGETVMEKTSEERSFNTWYHLKSNIGNQHKWMRMYHCRNKIEKKFDYKTLQEVYITGPSCKSKLCSNCSRIKGLTAVTKYQKSVEKMIDPVMVVLHGTSPKIGQLKDRIDSMYKDWRSIMKARTQSKLENYNGVCSLEVTTNEEIQTYHPHYHIIIEKHQVKELMNDWISKNPKQRQIHAHTNKKNNKLYTDVPKDKNGNLNIKELFKYALKLAVSNQENPTQDKVISSTPMIYEIAKALHGVQQWRPFGNFRNTASKQEIAAAILDAITMRYERLKLAEKWYWNYSQIGYLSKDKNMIRLCTYNPLKDESGIRFMNITPDELDKYQKSRSNVEREHERTLNNDFDKNDLNKPLHRDYVFNGREKMVERQIARQFVPGKTKYSYQNMVDARSKRSELKKYETVLLEDFDDYLIRGNGVD